MSFKDLVVEMSYSSPKDNISEEFMVPVLKEAVSYDRASGYFSSSSLLEIAEGIRSLMEKNGKIRMVISPNLSDKDEETIVKGYQMKDQKLKDDLEAFIEAELLKTFCLPKDDLEKERYNVLSHLISNGILDIRVAVMEDNPALGIFHDKVGILTDEEGNKVAFSGSMNETGSGYSLNHEHIDAFSSIYGDSRRIADKEKRFQSYWDNDDPTIEVFPFPKCMKKKIQEYEKPNIDWSLVEQPEKKEEPKLAKGVPFIPDTKKPRDYQQQAIDTWVKNGYRGFYDMATGTGKTITAISSIVRLVDDIKKPLIIVIVVPYTHLVNQWENDLKDFNFRYIPGYSQSPVKMWQEEFQKQIDYLELGMQRYACMITTNASFRTKKVQNMLSNTPVEKLLVVDEAHNFGSGQLKKCLDDRFKYRLALSATIDRHYDEEGTELLKDYFSPVCITYTLEQAIHDHKLINYEYYPIPVYLTESELEKYLNLTAQIGSHIKIPKGKKEQKKTKLSFDPIGEMLLRQRAQLVAGAENKIEKLKEVLKGIPDKDHLLVYCGTAVIDPETLGFVHATDSEIRQIDAVSTVLQKDFGLNSAKYTADVTPSERKELTKRFDKGDIQALAAIRCLDEGVDIPSIDKAIILASSTNPKEYIQRRGRVLRKDNRKIKAQIFDMVTLPTDLDEPIQSPKEAGLAKRELERIKAFADSALNDYDSRTLINEIENKYRDSLSQEEEF